MRVNREQAALNRERVLDAAAKLFRERGFGGVGVAELMSSRTYARSVLRPVRFQGRPDGPSLVRAFERSLERWSRAAARSPDDPLSAVVASYLSPTHRDEPGEGCVVPALGAEAARAGPEVRHAVTEGTKSMLEGLSRLVDGETQGEKRQRAVVLLAGMVGALLLARAVDDEALSKEILRAVKTSATRRKPAT